MRRTLGTVAIVCLLVASPRPVLGSDTWTDPHPGIRQLVRTASGPRRIFALVIDLCQRGVSIRATKSNERQRTVSSFANLVDAEAAINGNFFSYSDYSTTGLAIGGGEQWPGSRDGNGTGFIAFGRGRVEVSPPGDVIDPPPDWMRQVVSGRRPLVRDGEPFAGDDSDLCTTRHPRTAAGLSRDKRTLILAVVDGRSSRSIGMTCPELGTLMANLGAWDATNLDGGGSSAMWVRGSGVLNEPSDGAQRVVANHLAVLAHGGDEPGSCDRSWEEAAVHADAVGASTTTDVDGDGAADLCARAAGGVRCALSNGDSFEVPLDGPELADARGWGDETNWATLRMGDLDGDGRADLCARANAGIRCWLSEGAGFSTEAIVGPELSDGVGWAHPEYYGTLRMADVNGDGRDDLCARSASDFRCYPSSGYGFGEPVTLSNLSNENGWDAPSRYGTIRMGDVDGDGRADVCARAADGMRCWPSRDDGFGDAIEGPAWSNAEGWEGLHYWSTIRLADLDGDGRADLCARAATGLQCHLSTGDGFGEAIDGPAWSDGSGWADYDNYATLRFGDIDGDGALDVCARANAGIRCRLWREGGFGGDVVQGPALSNDAGWAPIRHASTIRLVDVDGDGRADLCARANAGMQCWLSVGTGFADEAIAGPDWSDGSGWGAEPYYESLRAVTPRPRCEDTPEKCNGVDDDCDGVIDEDCMADDDANAPPSEPTEGDAALPGYGGAAGCSCRITATPKAESPAWPLLALCALALLRRR